MSTYVVLCLLLSTGFTGGVWSQAGVYPQGCYSPATGMVAWQQRIQPGWPGRDRLWVSHLGGTAARPVWTAEACFGALGFSSSGRYVALRATDPATLDPTGQTSPVTNLKVIDLDGNELVCAPGVASYTWSPSSLQIAYITGVDREGYPGFSPTGCWILDVATGERHQFAAGAYDIYWAAHDGCIYLTDFQPNVQRYDPKSGSLEEMPYHGVFFSEDGRYYYYPGYEGSGFRVYETASNTDCTGEHAFLAFRPHSLNAQGWVRDHILAFDPSASGERSSKLFDLDTGIARKAGGIAIGAVPGGDSLLLLREGAFVQRPLTAMEVIPPLGELFAKPPALSAAAAGFPLLAEVPLSQPPFRLAFSQSGRHCAVEVSTTAKEFPVVYTNPASREVYVTRMPGAEGTWPVDDVLSVLVPDSAGLGVALPSYDAYLESRRTIDQAPESAGTLERLAVAAWTYCENLAYEVTAPGGVAVFETLKQLSEATRASFIPEADNASAANLAAAGTTYFTNQDGARVYQGQYLLHSTERLNMVKGSSTFEVPIPSSYNVESYSYEPLTERVCVHSPGSMVLWHPERGILHTFSAHAPDLNVSLRYHLVPGAPYLLMEATPDWPCSDYVDPWLEVWIDDGQRLAVLDTQAAGWDRARIHQVKLSTALVAVVLRPAGRQPSNYGVILRLFGVPQAPS
jgi:hypothetical protein